MSSKAVEDKVRSASSGTLSSEVPSGRETVSTADDGRI